ncbi:hypothetical protein [Sulfitobacter sp. 1A15299]|uniref:COG3904 family protein n=1 Tax=Sulfitobacter sp. 1A15299 TaxID=3368598 RepID=UPI0037457E02
MSVSDDVRCRVELTGPIERGDAETLLGLADQLLVHVGESTRGSTLCLDSPGGMLIEGMEMARFILEKGVSTFLREDATCASICAIMFMMGNYQGEEVAGISRRMHFSARLGFHRPYMTPDEALSYTSEDVASTYDLGMETVFDILTIANQRSPWGTAQMIEPELLQRILGTPGDQMFYVSTVEQALRWQIGIEGLPSILPLNRHRMHYACENALATRVALTSELNGPGGLLTDEIFHFQPLNSYSIQLVASVTAPPVSGQVRVISLRAGYSGVSCAIEMQGSHIRVCGVDEATDSYIGNCEQAYGMRYLSPLAQFHPRTQLVTLSLADAVGADARRISLCEIYDGSGKRTDRDPCLHAVVLMSESDNKIARHVITWPSGSRTVIDIGATFGETSEHVRINGAKGDRTNIGSNPNCVINRQSGNTVCISL